MATSELSERFTGRIGLQTFVKLESVLITEQIDRALLGSYTELNIDDLDVQLAMLRSHNNQKLVNLLTVNIYEVCGDMDLPVCIVR